MKIFLTGATGYIGGAVADALLAAGHTVTGLARSDVAAAKLLSKSLDVLAGDLKSAATLLAAAKSADAIIHAGTTNNGVADQEAVGRMVDAISGARKPFLYTSGIWVLGDTGGHVVDETAPLKPATLVSWRPGMEQMVLESAERGILGVVIRPGVVYGRGRGIPADFVKSARETGAARYVGTGENHWPMIHVEDLANLYVRALEKALAGTLFHAADHSRLRVKEIAEAASRGAGAGGLTEAWPLELARGVLGAYADALALDQLISSEKAESLLGWRPRETTVADDLLSGSYVA